MWDVVNEDQDFGTVQSQEKPTIAFAYHLSYTLNLRQ